MVERGRREVWLREGGEGCGDREERGVVERGGRGVLVERGRRGVWLRKKGPGSPWDVSGSKGLLVFPSQVVCVHNYGCT